MLVGLEVGTDSACAGAEERDGLVGLQRRHRQLVLAPKVQRDSARDQQLQPWSCGEELRDERRAAEQLFEVVHDDELPSRSQVRDELLPAAEDPADRWGDELRVVERGQVGEPDPVGEVTRGLCGGLEG